MMENNVTFDVKLAVDRDTVRRNVEYALSLDLPEIRRVEASKPPHATIVANGPTAVDAKLIGPYQTFALNGALKLFLGQHLAPDYWVVCDPQSLVTKFIEIAPTQTVYMVASQCDPSVFNRLRSGGCRVVVWHVDSDDTRDLLRGRLRVPSAPSITLCTLALLKMMGYRDINVYGWDACFVGQIDHAIPQEHTAERVYMNIGERIFETTPAWAHEVSCAVNMLLSAKWAKMRIKIYGPGMVGEMLKRLLLQPTIMEA